MIDREEERLLSKGSARSPAAVARIQSLHDEVHRRFGTQSAPLPELLRDPERFRHQDRFPGMQLLRGLPDPGRAAAPEGPDPERDARLVVAMAALYGWTVFGPQLRASFGVADRDDEALRRRIVSVLTGLLTPPSS